MPLEVRAFAPGRVNLIGEHTDYNRGLALPFAIGEGVTVLARTTDSNGGDSNGEQRIRARALDLLEEDEFELPNPPLEEGWRAFVRGIATELHSAGFAIAGAVLDISGDLPRGAGLSSSAALEVALALALLGLLDGESARGGLDRGKSHRGGLDRLELARLCSRVENEWVGAQTGLLDQVASLYGERDTALQIDFSNLDIQPVPLVLEDGWRLVTLDSGEPRALAGSGYNERRAECARACELLGVDSLRDADERSPDHLPPVLARRVKHVLEENARVLEAVSALHKRDLPRVGALLDASHASLRELYECSTPAVERAIARLRDAGAAGARMVGGGFGGHVLGLFPPDAPPPHGGREVWPSAGARLLD